jgi:DNA-binding response OmpR family regulator
MQKKILIIDDDRDIVEAMEAILQMENYVVLHAYTGGEGVSLAKKETPDLLLLDYMLPDINGREVAILFKKNTALSPIPIIIVSAAKEAQEAVDELQLNGHLEKPFDLFDLLDTVKRHLT